MELLLDAKLPGVREDVQRGGLCETFVVVNKVKNDVADTEEGGDPGGKGVPSDLGFGRKH